jgi:tRNA(Arg) A34 adenosine deaminase TadA
MCVGHAAQRRIPAVVYFQQDTKYSGLLHANWIITQSTFPIARLWINSPWDARQRSVVLDKARQYKEKLLGNNDWFVDYVRQWLLRPTRMERRRVRRNLAKE